MTASLPMYMRPELSDAHNTYWSLIQSQLKNRGITAPDVLQHPSDFDAFWNDPDLVLSQTCGMPYRNQLHGKVQLAGTPDFGIAGCQPGYYRSAIVVHAEKAGRAITDFKDQVLAFNSEGSQSGYSAAFQHFKKHGFWPQNRLQSNGHQASALAVVTGEADIASIDAVTWRLLDRYEDFTSQLHVLDWTDPTPGLPYITANTNDSNKVFDAVSAAIAELPADAQELLGIKALIKIDAADYLAVPNPDT